MTNTDQGRQAAPDRPRPALEVRHREALLASAARALRAWDIGPVDVRLVSHSENLVFRVDTRPGQSFVLRFHRPGYHTLPELRSELMWTSALNRSGIGAPVPCRTRDNRWFTRVALPELSQTRYAGLVEWVEGKSVAELIQGEAGESELANCFYKTGQLAARIHNQSAVWSIPAGFARHAFDVEGLVGAKPFWGPFWRKPDLSPGQRAQIIHARDRIREILSGYGKDRSRFSLIHADLHPGNLIVTGDRVHIIDFDDSGFGWHLYELAVAISYYQDSPYFDSIREAIIAGYRTERELGQADVELLPIFVLVRSLVSLGWIEQRPELDSSHKVPVLIRRACEQSRALFGAP